MQADRKRLVEQNRTERTDKIRDQSTCQRRTSDKAELPES